MKKDLRSARKHRESSARYYQKNRKKIRKYRKRFRERVLKEFFKSKGNKCERCGEIDQRTFEVHHKFPIGRKSGRERSVDAIRKLPLEELALLCANCHRIVHKTGNLTLVKS